MDRIFSALFILMFCSKLFSQDNSIVKHQLGIKVGLSDFHIIDELASPLIYKNITLTGCVDYEIKTKKQFHIFELVAYYGWLEPNLKRYDAKNIRASFRYTFLNKLLTLKIISKNLKIYLGGGIHSFLNHSYYYEYISKIGILNAPWYWSHSAEISALADYKIYPSNLFLQVNFSLISNVSRPSYSSYIPLTYATESMKPFGKMKLFWENLEIRTNVMYKYNINKWFTVLSQYIFQYISYNEPRKIAMYMNDFYIGVAFTL